MEKTLTARDQLIELARQTGDDLAQVRLCRRLHNQFGFAYQLAFAKVHNRFPLQEPFEIDEELLTYVALQLEAPPQEIETYTTRQQTVSEHQIRIRQYLSLRSFGDRERSQLQEFLFAECCRLEQTGQLRARVRQFLREHRVLEPAISALDRIIGEQRRQARQHLFDRLLQMLTNALVRRLDNLLRVEEARTSRLQFLKDAPGTPSAAAMLRLTEKLEVIGETGVLDLDLSWLNNNYQRSLARHARKCSAHRLREAAASHRYAALVCFLRQTYQDTIDFLIDMQDKLLNRVASQAQRAVDEAMKQRRTSIQRSASLLQTVTGVLLDEEIPDDAVRQSIFRQVSRETLQIETESLREWTDGKYCHEFHGVTRRFSYLRRFSPALLEALTFEGQDQKKPGILEAIDTLRTMNAENRRSLPEDAPTEFIPQKLQRFVQDNGTINRQAWECALLLSVRDELKSGNLAVAESKRFGQFHQFFIADSQWAGKRDKFFERAGLPSSPADVPTYLTARLNRAYDAFLQSQSDNSYATVDENGWHLSADPAEKLCEGDEQKLQLLRNWLAGRVRNIRLPQLLIEVDNELNFTRHFVNPARRELRRTDDVCSVLVTILALGCNIGPSTMARLTDDVSYDQLRRIVDWNLTRDNQRSALADVVKAISTLGTSKVWGEGRASSSDGQRYGYSQRVLQRTFSHKLSDFALEFYSFVADNYAPFFSTPIECTDRDAAYVLDGLLYNESDLALEEHYTDTHGYTEINFAAFAMLGKRFCPRIRGIQHQRLYRIDPDRDYGVLTALVDRGDRTIHLDWISDQWDRMGQFYASLESGHTTASVALKRLAGFSGKNHFYRANRELGRIFKTEFILWYLSQAPLRRRIRRGLLKGEQLHSLARDVFYGKRGRISAREFEEQINTCSCLTLILACIIYWQAREMERVITKPDPDSAGVDLSLLEHISPIEWENVLLYGQYLIDRSLIRTA